MDEISIQVTTCHDLVNLPESLSVKICILIFCMSLCHPCSCVTATTTITTITLLFLLRCCWRHPLCSQQKAWKVKKSDERAEFNQQKNRLFDSLGSQLQFKKSCRTRYFSTFFQRPRVINLDSTFRSSLHVFGRFIAGCRVSHPGCRDLSRSHH